MQVVTLHLVSVAGTRTGAAEVRGRVHVYSDLNAIGSKMSAETETMSIAIAMRSTAFSIGYGRKLCSGNSSALG